MKLGVEPMQDRTISVSTLETDIEFHARNTPCGALNDCRTGNPSGHHEMKALLTGLPNWALTARVGYCYFGSYSGLRLLKR